MTVLAHALLSWTQKHGTSALESRKDEVVEEIISGTTITSVSFDGSAGSGQVNRSPEELLGAMEEVLAYLEGRPDPKSHTADFSRRPLRT